MPLAEAEPLKPVPLVRLVQPILVMAVAVAVAVAWPEPLVDLA
jgi:hypothetical protein